MRRMLLATTIAAIAASTALGVTVCTSSIGSPVSSEAPSDSEATHDLLAAEAIVLDR